MEVKVLEKAIGSVREEGLSRTPGRVSSWQFSSSNSPDTEKQDEDLVPSASVPFWLEARLAVIGDYGVSLPFLRAACLPLPQS